MSDIVHNHLLHAVTYFLSYQFEIGRERMISEALIKYPVADYLTGLKIPIADVHLEYPHPILMNRRIDIVTGVRDDNKIEIAFEFKIAKFETKDIGEQKRIFNDLMRLYLLATKCNSSAYFMIVGKANNFIQYFKGKELQQNTLIDGTTILEAPTRSRIHQAAGFFNEWFSFRLDDVKSFHVRNSTVKNYQDIYDAFLEDNQRKVEKDELVLPDKITTKCLAISQIDQGNPAPYFGGVWQIN